MEHADSKTVQHVRVISDVVARAIYRRGLGLGPEEWSEFAVATERGGNITLVVGNSRDGVVEVMCPNPVLSEELRALVGFRIVSTLVGRGAP